MAAPSLTLAEQEAFQGYRILFEGQGGTMWIAADDGLAAWRAGAQPPSCACPPAERPAEVANFLEDAGGTLWMATKGEGIRRLRGDRISTIGVEQGLPSGWIVQLLEDGAGRLWASSSKGIFWVPRRELDEVADGRRLRVHPSLYDANDGIQIRSESFGHPAGFKDEQGRLWFATNSGVVVVDPPARPGRPAGGHRAAVAGWPARPARAGQHPVGDRRAAGPGRHGLGVDLRARRGGLVPVSPGGRPVGRTRAGPHACTRRG